MTPRVLSLLLLVAFLTSVPAAHAQHDPQRNATRFVAAGQFDKADAELKKADDKEPETHFVKMLNSLGRKDVEAAVEHAQAALDRGLPFARLAAGPRDALAPLRESDAWKKWAKEHEKLNLLHGPMLGNVTGSSVDVWIRTRKPAKTQVVVFGADNGVVVSRSEEKMTTLESDLTAVHTVKRLRPQTAYRYTVLLDGEPAMKLASFETVAEEGSPSKFRVAFGGGAGHVPKWEYMWDTILKEKPNALFMLGDNVYIDDPEQALTQDYCYYRRQARPEWRRLVGSTAVYAIYDDHDFGTNDCVPGPDIFKPAWKPEVFKRFDRNWANPQYGTPKQPGCWFDFYIGDVHFIMLDGRYYRDRKSSPPTMLGPVQRSWLFHTLKNSKGRFKVLASPVPWTVGIKPGSKDPWDGFPDEREMIFSFIEKNRINGLFLIAADRHRTDLRITKRESGFPFVEFESSKLTNRHTHGVVKTDGLVWGYNKTCSFGLMKFDTTADDPVVKFEAITIDGEVVHDHELKLSVITHK